MPARYIVTIKSAFMALLFCASTFGADELKYTPTMYVALWPERSLRDDPMHYASRKNDITHITKETRPSIEIFPSGDKQSAAVLVFPGGGFSTLAYDLEGTEIAHWLNSIGLTAIIVRYTVPGKSTAPFRDGQRAMRVVRKNAGQWGLDPYKIGVMGFSAGAYVVARLSTNWNEQTYAKIDDADDLSSRPDFAALVYPAYLNLKKNGELRKDLKINPGTPPTFIVHTKDDFKYVNGSILYSEALKQAGIDVEFELYESGGHGFGVRSSEDTEVSKWTKKFETWVHREQ
jgi:acetyl esterase/lipase